MSRPTLKFNDDSFTALYFKLKRFKITKLNIFNFLQIKILILQDEVNCFKKSIYRTNQRDLQVHKKLIA